MEYFTYPMCKIRFKEERIHLYEIDITNIATMRQHVITVSSEFFNVNYSLDDDTSSKYCIAVSDEL